MSPSQFLLPRYSSSVDIDRLDVEDLVFPAVGGTDEEQNVHFDGEIEEKRH